MAADDCEELYDRTADFVVDYTGYASDRPVAEALSAVADDGLPPLVAGMFDGVRQARSRADDLGCEGEVLLEELRVAATRARDAADSPTSRLLVAQFEAGPDLRALSRALTVVTEAQEAYRKSLGVYASDATELESRMSSFADLKEEEVEVTVVSAGQDSYCATVQVPDLPTVHLESPGIHLSADGCSRSPNG